MWLQKTDDELSVFHFFQIYSYFLFVFSVVSKKVQSLKILKVMQLFWKSLLPCKNRRKKGNTFFGQSLMHHVVFLKRNYQASEVVLKSVPYNCLIGCNLIVRGYQPGNTANTTVDLFLLVENDKKNTEKNVKFFQTLFLSAYLTGLRLTLGHWQGGNLTRLMLITTIF